MRTELEQLGSLRAPQSVILSGSVTPRAPTFAIAPIDNGDTVTFDERGWMNGVLFFAVVLVVLVAVGAWIVADVRQGGSASDHFALLPFVGVPLLYLTYLGAKAGVVGRSVVISRAAKTVEVTSHSWFFRRRHVGTYPFSRCEWRTYSLQLWIPRQSKPGQYAMCVLSCPGCAVVAAVTKDEASALEYLNKYWRHLSLPLVNTQASVRASSLEFY